MSYLWTLMEIRRWWKSEDDDLCYSNVIKFVKKIIVLKMTVGICKNIHFNERNQSFFLIAFVWELLSENVFDMKHKIFWGGAWYMAYNIHLLLVLVIIGTHWAVYSDAIFFSANNLNEVDKASIILDSFYMNFTTR